MKRQSIKVSYRNPYDEDGSPVVLSPFPMAPLIEDKKPEKGRRAIARPSLQVNRSTASTRAKSVDSTRTSSRPKARTAVPVPDYVKFMHEPQPRMEHAGTSLWPIASKRPERGFEDLMTRVPQPVGSVQAWAEATRVGLDQVPGKFEHRRQRRGQSLPRKAVVAPAPPPAPAAPFFAPRSTVTEAFYEPTSRTPEASYKSPLTYAAWAASNRLPTPPASPPKESYLRVNAFRRPSSPPKQSYDYQPFMPHSPHSNMFNLSMDESGMRLLPETPASEALNEARIEEEFSPDTLELLKELHSSAFGGRRNRRKKTHLRAPSRPRSRKASRRRR